MIGVKCPCQTCLRGCRKNQNCIECDICLKWFHLKCTNLSLSEFEAYTNNEQPYFCMSCYNDIFPFNTLSQEDFRKTINWKYMLHKLNNCTQLDSDPENDDMSSLVIDNKYNSVKDFSNIADKCKGKKQNNLNLIHFNTRSPPKNRNKIEDLFSTLTS